MINQTPEDINKLETTLSTLDLFREMMSTHQDITPDALKAISTDVNSLVSWYGNMHTILTDPTYAQEMYDPSDLNKD